MIMKFLKEIFPEAQSQIQVKNLVFDSRLVKEGSVFFAIKGSNQDGHLHLESAVKNKASALVVSSAERVPKDFKGEVLVVSDTRQAMSAAARAFFGDPSSTMKLFGVTGTNGKTTCAYMFEAMMTNLGSPTGVMGTIDHHFKSKVWKSSLTTPDVIGVFERLKDFRDLGSRSVAMEVSSHALDQRRVEGLEFDVALWTNLTRDHLDYHGTLEKYFQAKEILFRDHLKKGGVALINSDDSLLSKVQVSKNAEIFRYGRQGDFQFDKVDLSLAGSTFQFSSPFGSDLVEISTPGLHNVANACGVLAAGLCLGQPFNKVTESLRSFKGAPGRLELVHSKPYVFVDYAHTPDALASSLSSLHHLKKAGQKIIAVFGFGGDRDRGKRPLMVREALLFADHVVLTSDNPRHEDPEQILRDGLPQDLFHLKGTKVDLEVDRRKGIHKALQRASEGDVILIAGKGHEDYQIIGDQRLPFSDHQVVREYFID